MLLTHILHQSLVILGLSHAVKQLWPTEVWTPTDDWSLKVTTAIKEYSYREGVYLACNDV